MTRAVPWTLVAGALALLAVARSCPGAAWIAADWAGKEPKFPPGSLYWQTNNHKDCPVLYRTVVQVQEKPLVFAALEVHATQYAFVFLNGRQIAGQAEKDAEPVSLTVDLADVLRPGANVLVVSAKADGFVLDGVVAYRNGPLRRLASSTDGWKVQKVAPLTILEYEPFMRADFDAATWFGVKDGAREAFERKDDEWRELGEKLTAERGKRLSEDHLWRVKMLQEKGIAIVDGEAHDLGAALLSDRRFRVVRNAAQTGDPVQLGLAHLGAEVLCGQLVYEGEAVNLECQARGLTVLKAPAEHAEACRAAATRLKEVLEKLRGGNPDRVRAVSDEARSVLADLRKTRVINPLNRALDNKFSWLDTAAVVDSDPARWGLRLTSPARLFAGPYSPAAVVTLEGKDLVLEGWDKLEPLRVYKKPPVVGPVGLWVVLDGKVTSLKPGDGGVVYDAAKHGKLSENWALLVSNMESGGHLPIQLVFLRAPKQIVFRGEKGTTGVSVSFEQPGAQLFLLRPLKEWRGFLQTARVLNQHPLKENEARGFIETCRLWSRAVLDYPVSFSEAFVKVPDEKWALDVADVYSYQTFQDEWDTKPLRLALLPPLACYGLLTRYPGLKVLSDAKTLGSWGLWGDLVAVEGDCIAYRVPLDPFRINAGFTSYCFGGTDIGEPGSLTEILTIKSTGANSFRPQHNQTGERAMKTARWCVENGIQNVFNTDEKWVPDVVEHYRTLARQCKDFPPDLIAYDLLNEPETRDPRAYGALMKKITAAIRAEDPVHLIYVETMPPWGPGAAPFPKGAFETCEPTGDARTVYSFHDYEYRLPPRWPNEKNDVRDLVTRWIPAFRFAIDHRTPIHLGEWGGFEQTKESVYENPCTLTMMNDYLGIFEQFGWHWHYYANRGVTRVRADGSLQESYVQEACRKFFARGTFNVNRGN